MFGRTIGASDFCGMLVAVGLSGNINSKQLIHLSNVSSFHDKTQVCLRLALQIQDNVRGCPEAAGEIQSSHFDPTLI